MTIYKLTTPVKKINNNQKTVIFSPNFHVISTELGLGLGLLSVHSRTNLGLPLKCKLLHRKLNILFLDKIIAIR